jgi:hypothetical protein
LYEYLTQRKPDQVAAPTETRHDQSVPVEAGK